jgi:hypothetical protein
MIRSKMLQAAAAVCLTLPLAMAQEAPAAPSKTPSAQAQQKAYGEMLLKDLANDKNAVVDQAMALDPADKAKFWGVYDGYQKEMKGIWQQRAANIKKYAGSYDKMTDPVADELANTALSIQGQVLAIRKKYYGQMKQALGAKVAARFLQVEDALGQVIGLQLASEIPLVK